MMLRIHDLDMTTERHPEGLEPGDGSGVSASRWGQNAPAAIEQFGKTRLRPRVLRARDRMAGNEMHARRNKWTNVAHNRALDGADVRNDGAGLQCGRN